MNRLLLLLAGLLPPEALPAPMPPPRTATTPYKLLQAEAMLRMPRDVPVLPDPDDAELHAALHRVCLRLEIMDDRERGYLSFRTAGEGWLTMDALRMRLADLEDAPPLAAAWWLPDKEHLTRQSQFNRAFLLHLQSRLLWEPDLKEPLTRAIQETEALYRVYDLARDVRSDFFYLNTRRRALMLLRDRLGQEAFDRGELPPCVPAWAFVERGRR